jgi:hypothetical protein
MWLIGFFMFFDQMAFHKGEFEPCCIKNTLFLGRKITKERHYNKSDYSMTFFLFNKEVDKFFPIFYFGKNSLQVALRF